ncbi:MAG: prepilin-type N-terminal cleavage/methylation domain-containing protein [bacterium]|nr:prepilin-type N-terminal cleavage/methylation domain-containing protein [bacterium]
MSHNVRLHKGFTLIELLIVIAIIAILVAGVIIGLNPARQFSLARNSQRWSHANAFLNAVSQNMVDNRGTFTCAAAGALPAVATVMGSGAGEYNICSCLVPTYLSALPFDPSTGSYTDCATNATGYNISREAASGRITIAAPGAEVGAAISVTR